MKMFSIEISLDLFVKKRPFFLTAMLMFALLLTRVPQTASANCDSSITVSSASTLNTAINDFNKSTGADCTFIIEFGNNIALTQDVELIDNIHDAREISLVIDGNGYHLDGGYQHRLLRFDNIIATIKNLTITQGSKYGIYADKQSIITLSNVTLSHNREDGIKNVYAALNIYNSNIHNNGERGVYVENWADLTHLRVVILNTSVYSNGAQGIHLHESYGGVIKNSTFYNNGEEGIRNGEYESKYERLAVSNLSITNSTVSANKKAGIRNIGGELAVYHTTSTQNQANGILTHKWGKAKTSIYNSIFANNAKADCAHNKKSDKLAVSYSLVGTQSKCTLTNNENGNLVGVNPQLGTLADNGGYTQSYLLTANSPAIDAIPHGTNGCATNIRVDQRDEQRIRGQNCDMGAVEMQGSELSGTAVSPSTTTTNLPLILILSGVLLVGMIGIVVRQRQAEGEK